MRMRHVLVLAGMAVFGGGMACGGGGGSDIALSDLPPEIAQATCGKAFECCTAAEFMDQYGVATEAECVTQFTALLQSQVGVWQAAIDAGRLAYHAGNAGGCISALNDMSCADYAGSGGDPTGSCDDPFEGLVAADGACSSSDECVSGYCEGATTSPPADGACKTRPAIGAMCPDFTCVDGAYCEFGAMGSTCVATKADGMSCNGGYECTSGGCNGGDPMMGTPGMCGAPTDVTCNGQ